MPGGGVKMKIRRFDLFPKFDRRFEVDARQRTVSGGIFSVVSLAIILTLILGETRYFLSTKESQEMLVDPTVGGDMLVTVNLTFHRIPCDLIAIDAIDAFGAYIDPVATKATKKQVEADTLRPLGPKDANDKKTATGKPPGLGGAEKSSCPPCYGAELHPGSCCITCTDVYNAYRRKGWNFNVEDPSLEQCADERILLASAAASKEGCNIYTRFSAARVTGNLHFILGRIYTHFGSHFVDSISNGTRNFNMSHVIHQLEFGESFPGQLNPLTGVEQIRGRDTDTGARHLVNGRFSYFVKIVPTRYETSSLLFGTRTARDSNQYSVTHHFTPSFAAVAEPGGTDSRKAAGPSNIIPGVFFAYDLSPIKVHVIRAHPYSSLAHFVLQLCTVCGCVFTVGGLVDSLLFHGMRHLEKHRKGKLI